MLYKQAWQELKAYIKNRLPLLVGQGVIRQRLLEEMNELEKRWKIIPKKKGVNDESDKKKVKYRYCPQCKKETVTQKDNAGIDYVVLCCTCGHAWIENGIKDGK